MTGALCCLPAPHLPLVGMRLAPDAGGGRVTAKRTAPKLNGIVIDPNTTSVIEFAKLIHE